MSDSLLDIAELVLSAVPVVELMRDKPNYRKVIDSVIALQVLQYKRLGYDVKVKMNKRNINKIIKELEK